MKLNMWVAGTVAALSLGGAANAGCLGGAVVGGVAGHFAGHHALLGAGAGCVAGHYLARRHHNRRYNHY